MSLDRYFILAAVFVLGCLLALARTQARAKPDSGTTLQLVAIGENVQSPNYDRQNNARALFANTDGKTPTANPMKEREKESSPVEPDAGTRFKFEAPPPLSFANPAKLN